MIIWTTQFIALILNTLATQPVSKTAFRLAIRKASSEGWLAEHMLLMGVLVQIIVKPILWGFPSACGKTSTALLPGETILGTTLPASEM